MKFGPVVQEEMSFKEKVYGRIGAPWRDDGQRPITKAHLELKKLRIDGHARMMDKNQAPIAHLEPLT